jgi:hypothetical protein
MRANEFLTNIDEMAANLGGLEYERSVASTVRHAISNFSDQITTPKLDCGSAGFCRFSIDLELIVGKHPFNIEIKQNTKAQMGGTSVRYQNQKAEIVDVDRIDLVARELIIKSVQSKGPEINDYLEYIGKQKPIAFNRQVIEKRTIPFICTRNAWDAAKSKGLLKKLNAYFDFDNVDAITRGYNKKGVYYIQIGGAGLFYMNKNPLKLPIPEFEGTCQIRARLARGSTLERNGYEVVYGQYRAIANLLTKVSSPYSLDNPDQTQKLFQIALANQNLDKPTKPQTKIPKTKVTPTPAQQQLGKPMGADNKMTPDQITK